MRLFEILSIGLLLCSVGMQVPRRPGRSVSLPLFYCVVVALMLHLVFEGAHWQMLPAYLGVLLAGPLLLSKTAKARGTLSITIFLLSAASCIAAAVLPIFQLPLPTGPYAIGTRMLYLRDKSRTNAPAEADPNSPGRDIVVQLWYPATPSHHRFAPYRFLSETTLLSSYMSVVPTHARLDAPILRGDKPWHVLLFNPAWESRRTQSTALVEDLASHGFVVATIDHPGRTGPMQLGNGRIIPIVPDPDLDDLGHSSVDRVETALAREVDTEAADDSFVLDQLALQNSDPASPYHDRLDTEHAGALGHSLGGAVAADVCFLDPRVRSALSMSSGLYGKVRATGLPKPWLSVSEVVPLATPEQIARMDHAGQIDAETDVLDAGVTDRLLRANGGYQVILQGLNHSSFTDSAFYSPIHKLSGEDGTPRDRVVFLLRQYAEQFFAKTLEGQPSSLLDNPPITPTHPFPEATQQYFPFPKK